MKHLTPSEHKFMNSHKLAARLRAIATKLENRAKKIQQITFNQNAEYLIARARELRSIADALKPKP